MGNTSPTYRIVLVHGTFARGAAWTRDDSHLADALRHGLDGSVAIERCDWSGGNSTGARADGATRLADHLRGMGDKPAHERRVVIAHSHGGNVALYALRDPAVAARVDAVVTMATPFLVARRRDLGPKGIENLLVVLLLGLLAVYGGVLAPRLPASIGEQGRLALLLLWSWAGGLVLFFLYRRWDRLADRLLATLRLAELPPERLLVVRNTGDEASALLLFFQFVSLLAVRLFHAMQRLHAGLERVFVAWSAHKLALVMAALAGAGAIVGALAVVLQAGVPLAPGVVTALVAAMAVAIALLGLLLLGWIGPATALFRFVASLALAPAALALAVCMLPIDWRVALANLLIDVTVEAAPPGEWTLWQFVPERSPARRDAPPGLAHSAVYEDERVLRAIVDWISRRGATQAPGG